MKKHITLSILAMSTIFLLSNFSSITNNNGQFIFMFLEEEPVLPATPYTYRDDIVIPSHFASSIEEDTIEFGYGRGEMDSTFRDNITDNAATLGRVLFYDKKLSALENISCASCHNQASSFADPFPTSEGVSQNTKRNSMHLNDLGWTDNHNFFWDMSQNNIHEMIRLPLMDENEIGADMDEIAIKLLNTAYYPELFANAYGTQDITEEKIIDAIVQFMHSMTTFNSRFDELASNGLDGITDQELHGLELFSSFCSECHVEGDRLSVFGINEEDNIELFEFMPFLFNNGMPIDDNDLGVGEWYDNEFGYYGYEELNFLFKAPTLRNIELTGPYMHDGSMETLEDVLDFYSDESIANEWSFIIPDGGYGFNEDEKSALISFLKTLTDDTFINDPKFSDPFDISNATVSEDPFEKMVVKPNPMGDFSIIELNTKPDAITELSILNGIGQVVLKETITGSTFQLDKGNFDSGIYYLNFTRGTKKSTQKLIVQ